MEEKKRALKEEVLLAGDGSSEKNSQVKEPMENTINEEKAQLPDQLRQSVEEGARVFISYSHEDEEYRKVWGQDRKSRKKKIYLFLACPAKLCSSPGYFS